jgi:hypothetical protein
LQVPLHGAQNKAQDIVLGCVRPFGCHAAPQSQWLQDALVNADSTRLIAGCAFESPFQSQAIKRERPGATWLEHLRLHGAAAIVRSRGAMPGPGSQPSTLSLRSRANALFTPCRKAHHIPCVSEGHSSDIQRECDGLTRWSLHEIVAWPS